MYDAVIVGLGPTGATMANLLGQRGWNVAVLDRAAEVYDKPRAITADHEAMRVFQAVGLAEDIATRTTPHPGTDFIGLRGQLIKKFYPADPPGPLGWDPSFMFIQPELESILRRGLHRFANVSTHLATELVALKEADESVVIHARSDTGEPLVLQAAWVLGCDGASSTVRRLMSGTFEDLEFDEEWLVIDAEVDDPARFPTRCIQYCRPSRPGTFIVGPGRLRRWEIKLLPGEGASTFDHPAALHAVLAEFTTEAALRIVRHAIYRFHAVVADRWRFGRVLLLGDAAHQMPPFMGQGMCAGIRDAVNLDWKLDAAHRYRATSLLDTYEEERKAHVRSVVAHTRAFGRIIGEMDPDAAADRDRRLEEELRDGTAETVRQNFIPRIASGAIAVDGRTGARIGDAGDLFPQPWVETVSGDRVRMDTVLSEVFTVVSLAAAEWLDDIPLPQSPLVSRERVDVRRASAESRTVIDGSGCLIDWAERNGAVIAVVRPDRHVYGTAANREEAERLMTTLAADLARWIPVTTLQETNL